MRQLDFTDGFTSATEPDHGDISANSLRVYANDAAFLADKEINPNVAEQGDFYLNSTLNCIRYCDDGTNFRTVVDATKNFSLAGIITLLQKVFVKEGFGNGIDTTAAGILEVGKTNATEVRVGDTGKVTRIMGDLIVEGDNTIVNTQTLDVEDYNITVNKGGNDATSEGAGLTADRTGTKGTIIYKAASATKWAAGSLGSEVDLVGTTSIQALTNKTIDADQNTITNIEDVDIKSGAAISRAKLANGTADHVLINSGAGVMTSEAQLAVSRGGTGFGSFTAGDILVATGPTTLAKLAIGTTNQVLTVISGLPSWQPAAGGGGGSSFAKLMTSSTDGHIFVSSITGLVYEFT